MTEQTAAEPVDFTLLDETAKKLLGYYVYRKFRTYLGSSRPHCTSNTRMA